jgi:hypothetical protein
MATTNKLDPRTKRQQYEARRSALMSERNLFDAHYRELAEYILPRRARLQVSDRNQGDRRNSKIVNSTATFAARTLESGMHAGITNPKQPWLQLSTPDPELAEFGPVKAWLHTVTQRMRSVLLQSNFYTSMPGVYGDMGVFGTPAMGILEDDTDDLLHCQNYPVGSFALGISRKGKVNTFVREYQLTVLQMAGEFGLKSLSRVAREQYDKGNYENLVDVCWIISPNPDADTMRLESRYLPFYSCHFEKAADTGEDKERFLREKGFNEFPIIAPRWRVGAEEVYASECPGMTALGDIRALQTLERRKAQAIEKMVNPPLQAPTHLLNKIIASIPGGVTHVDAAQAQQGVRTLYDIQMSVEEVLGDIARHEFRINQAFFVNFFQMLTSSPGLDAARTAREIDERHEEKIYALGPVLECINDGGLDPAIDRVFGIMLRRGEIPPAPPDLEDVALKVEYTSLLGQALKLIGVVGMDRFFASTVPLMEHAPELRHKVRWLQAADDYADALGLNPKLIVSDDEAQASMAQEAQARNAMMQAEQTSLAAKSARDLGGTDLSKDTALRRILEGVTP